MIRFPRLLGALRPSVPGPAPGVSADHVTVAVISHNYGRYLEESVHSVLGQTVVPRIILMDDASSDETADLAADLQRRASGRLRYHRAASNRGLSRTRNSAAALAETEWIVYLDADDWLAPEFVERGVRFLDRHPSIDALTTDMWIVRPAARRRFRARIPRRWQGLLRANTIVATSFIRRRLVLEQGGYDPDLDFEDWEFWIRWLKAGRTIARLPGPHVYRREHGLNKSKLCDERRATDAVRQRHPVI